MGLLPRESGGGGGGVSHSPAGRGVVPGPGMRPAQVRTQPVTGMRSTCASHAI